MNPVQPLRLGVIGACASHAQRAHIPAALRTGVAEVVAGYDTNAEGMAALRRSVPTMKAFGSVEALLGHSLDGVLICSPDKYHVAQLALAVEAGIPLIWLEKPWVVDPAELALLLATLDAAEEKGLIVTSCHPRRHYPVDLAYGWMVSMLERLRRRYGRLLAVSMDSSYPTPGTAWKLAERSFLLDKLSHDLDWLAYFLGLSDEAAFTLTNQLQGCDEQIVAARFAVAGSVEYMGEAVALSCSGSRLHEGRKQYVEVTTLRFESGQVTVDVKHGVVTFFDHVEGKQWRQAIAPMTEGAYDRVFDDQMRGVVTAFRDGKAPIPLGRLIQNALVPVGLVG